MSIEVKKGGFVRCCGGKLSGGGFVRFVDGVEVVSDERARWKATTTGQSHDAYVVFSKTSHQFTAFTSRVSMKILKVGRSWSWRFYDLIGWDQINN